MATGNNGLTIEPPSCLTDFRPRLCLGMEEKLADRYEGQ